jgi:hypothetical protein
MRARIVLLVALLGVPVEAPADPAAPAATREEQWRRKREEKGRQPPRPPRPSFLERQVLALEKAERPSLLDLHYKGLWPTFAALASGSRVAPGVRFWEPKLFGSRVSLHASAAYSVAKYQLYDAQLGLIPHTAARLPHRSTKGDDVYELGSLEQGAAPGLVFYGSFRARRHPRERYYGLGGGSRESDLTAFAYEDTLAELVAGWQFGRHLSLTARGGVFEPSAGRGEDPERPSIETRFGDAGAPGLGSEPEYVRSTAQVFYDRRDVPFNPHRGFVLTAAATRFDERGGERWSFDRVAVDARGYLPLGSVQRVLALRAYVSRDDPGEGSAVPFFLQEALSNSHTLRGYQSFRYRGEKLLSLQAEYRWEAAPALELAAFLDAGRAFRAHEDLEISGLRTTYGGGLRIKSWSDTLFRLDVGRSREGTRVYARFGAAF